MILLDTAPVPPRDRAELIRAAMLSVSVPKEVTLASDADATWARMEFWDLGGPSLFTSASSSFQLARGRRHLTMEGPALVALAVQTGATAGFEQLGQEHQVRPGQLMLNDLTAAYRYGWRGDGGSCAFQLPHELLGLPVGATRAAAPRLAASPLYELTRTHLAQLHRHRGELEHDPSARALGRATLELVRALILSAAAPAAPAAPDTAAELRERAIAYIDVHLSNPALTPAAIAAAHHVSVRQLYKVFALGRLSLEQTIIGLRLEAARRELARPGHPALTVSEAARRCGFANLSHFARRFRQRYGISPARWQRQHRDGRAASSRSAG
ncbi:MAG TPA: helix-turn-helix domain-containing protein [Streptosporangiaceae bacterium]